MRHFQALTSFTAIATAVTSSALAQSPDMQISTSSNVVSIDITNATPNGLVALAIDPRICAADVDGDRQTTASDVNAIMGRFGPCMNADDKLYDLDDNGFVNQLDVDLALEALGCSDLQSLPIPGCSSIASINPATATIVSLFPDGSGACSVDVPIAASLDAALYFQATDVANCGITPLVSYRALGDAAYVAPRNQATVAVRSDFFQPIAAGIVGLSTDLDGAMTVKSSIGQIEAMCDISPGTTAVVTLGETPCGFVETSGDVYHGVALGMIETFQSEFTQNPTSRLQHLIQPVAMEARIGASTEYAPFSGVWGVIPPPGTPSYQPFDAKIASLPTRNQAEDVLSYYSVDVSTLENATCAIVLRVDEDVKLGNGPSHTRGFGLSLQNYAAFQSSPYVATRFLAAGADPGTAPSISVTSFDGKTTGLRVDGQLSAGEYWFLLSSTPFSQSFDQHTKNPPAMGDTGADNGGGCGTPPAPTNPPVVGGGPCQGGLGLTNLHDCVITGYYTSATDCEDLGPFLAATGGGPEGYKVHRDKTTSYKGSANVNVTIGGVGISVGTEVSHSSTVGDEYTAKEGNGCGENFAWYLYEKHCVTRYWIRFHDWEWFIPVGWCTECCSIVDSPCVGESTTVMEVCSRDC